MKKCIKSSGPQWEDWKEMILVPDSRQLTNGFINVCIILAPSTILPF